MRLSDNGRSLIKSFEGFSSKAYPDADGWSIGYGHFLGKDPSLASRTITTAEADQLFDQDVSKFEAAVSVITPQALQHEFDAFTSLAYNIGTGAFSSSTAAKRHNAGDKAGAAEALQWFTKSQGKDLPVLVKRRAKEASVYLHGFTAPGSFPVPAPQQSIPGWPETTTLPKPPSSWPAPVASALPPDAPRVPAAASASVASLAVAALGWLIYRLIHR